MIWLSGVSWISIAAATPCTFEIDGAPSQRLDCAVSGAWRVRCPLPGSREGKLRARIEIPERGIEAELRLPLSSLEALDVPLAGPSGRAGVFLVREATAGLLSGQALGPMQLCPVVQPDVAAGSPPRELELQITLTKHSQTGFAEEVLEGGVVNRVPVYGDGQPVAEGRATLVQLPVGALPLSGAPPLRDEPVHGNLQVRSADGWIPLSWQGSLRDVPADGGELLLLSVDLAASEIAAALGSADAPVASIEEDLRLWLSGDPDSRLGLAVWRRSGLSVPIPGAAPGGPFASHTAGGVRWRRADLDRATIWIGSRDDRVRVVIASHPQRLSPAAEGAITEAALRDL